MSDARVIYDVSVTMGLPQRAAVIAEATAMQESSLVNLPDGTSDSLGLFQQRPSQGWGTPAQIMQPVYASTRFYEALVSVPGWQSLPLTVAAQAVQGSATPGAYAKWESLADSLVATFSGSADNCLTDNGTGVPQSGITHLPAGFALPSGTPQAVVTAIAYAADQLGKPYIWGGVGPAGYDCSGLVMMAYEAAGISLPRTTFQQVYAGHAGLLVQRPRARRPPIHARLRRHSRRPRPRRHVHRLRPGHPGSRDGRGHRDHAVQRLLAGKHRRHPPDRLAPADGARPLGHCV